MRFSLLKRLFSGEKDPLDSFEATIGYRFQDRNLLVNALSHRSSVENGRSNERLEYLGDAVLGLIVSEFLFGEYPDLDEGDLTKMKASLVNEAILSRVAGEFGLGDFIFLSSEEEKSGGRQKQSIVADAAEAVLGAVYLDGGLSAARRIVNKFFLTDYESLLNDESSYNYKGELLEKIQGCGKGLPRYEIQKEIGPDHEKQFVISVSVGGKNLGQGEGSTKKEAEQKAAKMALRTLRKKEKGD